MSTSYDAIIIGGGHNGLVAAGYLQAAGLKTLTLEARPVVGGACVTEEVFPGYKVSTTSYLCSLLQPKIIRELELEKHGLSFIARNPTTFFPLPDGRSMVLYQDPAQVLGEIARFSKKDAEAYPRYEEHLDKLAGFVEQLLMAPPPDPLASKPGGLLELARFGLKSRALKDAFYDNVRILSMSCADFLDRWFESDVLKTLLATDGVIGAFAGPKSAGTAYVLLHHVMGEAFGKKGHWAYVRGGMGGITQAMASSLRARGGEIRTGARVARILVRDGRARGVALESGEELAAKLVLSNADPKRTFVDLLAPGELPAEFLEQVRRIRFRSGVFKLNLALGGLPNWKARPTPDGKLAPHHGATIHLSPSVDYLEAAFQDAATGIPSRSPMLECTMASAYDETLAPKGKHVMSVFVQYTPYSLKDGASWDTAREPFTKRCLEILEDYAPGFGRLVEGVHTLTPVDMEREYGLTGGNIFHGEMTLDQLFFMRPLPSWSRYRTPVRGLYLCGSGAHPGGGVMGACGYNAAREALKG